MAFGTHFLILFGYAHAGACIGLVEVLYFPYFTAAHTPFVVQEADPSWLNTVGFLGFLGNLCMLLAVWVKRPFRPRPFYLAGLLCYWAGIAFLFLDAVYFGNVQFSPVFVLPFLVVTAWPLLRQCRAFFRGWLEN